MKKRGGGKKTNHAQQEGMTARLMPTSTVRGRKGGDNRIRYRTVPKKGKGGGENGVKDWRRISTVYVRRGKGEKREKENGFPSLRHPAHRGGVRTRSSNKRENAHGLCRTCDCAGGGGEGKERKSMLLTYLLLKEGEKIAEEHSYPGPSDGSSRDFTEKKRKKGGVRHGSYGPIRRKRKKGRICPRQGHGVAPPPYWSSCPRKKKKKKRK